jgi:hypothetical protein
VDIVGTVWSECPTILLAARFAVESMGEVLKDQREQNTEAQKGKVCDHGEKRRILRLLVSAGESATRESELSTEY